MVYSTCTFNPIEDEAVVAELLVRCKGALQLVDVSQQLPELKRLPGKRKWRVRDKFRWYDSWAEAEKVGRAGAWCSC
jgi:16S rRNA C967 or C1407 C5-methylase (RsmB/RsmF family)